LGIGPHSSYLLNNSVNSKPTIMIFGRPFVKRFALCYRTVFLSVCPVLSCPVLSCLSVCDVGVLWPNGSMDQDETWHAGRPRPWPHCIGWGPSSPSSKGTQPPILAHISCGQMAGWIKLPLGMEVGLGPGVFVLCGDPAPLPKRGRPPNFRPISVVVKRLNASRCHLVWRDLGPGHIALDGDPASPLPKEHAPL